MEFSQNTVPIAGPMVNSQQPIQDTRNWFLRHKILTTLMLIGVLVVCLIGIAFYASSDARSAAHTYLETIAEGNIEQSYSASSQVMKDSTSYADFVAFVEANEILTTQDSVSFTGVNVKNTNGVSTAILTGSLLATNGESSPLTIGLVKESGEWRVYQLKLAVDIE